MRSCFYSGWENMFTSVNSKLADAAACKGADRMFLQLLHAETCRWILGQMSTEHVVKDLFSCLTNSNTQGNHLEFVSLQASNNCMRFMSIS